MIKIKLFSGESPEMIQRKIDTWITESDPYIKTVKTTAYGNHGILITILYKS